MVISKATVYNLYVTALLQIRNFVLVYFCCKKWAKDNFEYFFMSAFNYRKEENASPNEMVELWAIKVWIALQMREEARPTNLVFWDF